MFNNIEYWLVFSAILLCLGIFGLLYRRVIFLMFLAIELMFNAAGLAFVIIGNHLNQPDGQIFYLFIFAVAAAEVCIGLALAIKYNAVFNTLDRNAASLMRY
jgi:NADH-quinone oxidoreductase subunit K